MPNLFLLAQDSVANESLFNVGADERFVVLLVIIGCLTGVVLVLGSIAGSVVGSIHRRNAEYDLKRDMLDRGMTAEEITQVIEAAPQPEDGFDRWVASWCSGKKKERA